MTGSVLVMGQLLLQQDDPKSDPLEYYQCCMGWKMRESEDWREERGDINLQ